MTLTLTDVTVRRGIGPVISDVSLEIVPGRGDHARRPERRRQDEPARVALRA